MSLNKQQTQLADALEDAKSKIDDTSDTLADLENAEDRESKADYIEQLEANAIDLESVLEDLLKVVKKFTE